MVSSLLMSSFLNMKIVSWSDLINMSDLLMFVPLLYDLTGDICIRFWSCLSKNFSKESIPSLSKETSLSLFPQIGVLLGRETVGVVLTVFELLSDGWCKGFHKKKDLAHLVGLFIITPSSSRDFILSQKEPWDMPLSSLYQFILLRYYKLALASSSDEGGNKSDSSNGSTCSIRTSIYKKCQNNAKFALLECILTTWYRYCHHI